MVAVFVSHDIRKDEWVCQIPYFPPFQHPSVRFPFILSYYCCILSLKL